MTERETAWQAWAHPRLMSPADSLARRDRNYARYGFDAGWEARDSEVRSLEDEIVRWEGIVGSSEPADALRQRESAATARNIAVGALNSILSGASDPKATAARALNEISQVYDEGIGAER